jgi:cysteine desulfurase
VIPIYLDYNATTPIDPAVLEAMLPYLREHFGNPSSTHPYGQQTRQAVNRAREQVAALIGAEPEEIVFTSGGTEASNHAIKGAVFKGGAFASAHLITSAIEHPATLQPCRFLERLGCRLTVVGVDGQGRVDLQELKRALAQGATLVSIMHANNEVGTVEPIAEVAALTRPRGVLLHTDAAQSLGKIPVNVNDLGVDLLTIAGHKLYAPKGVGALYIRRGVQLEPLLHGAGHESGRRASTENVPYIVALGAAAAIARSTLAETTRKLQALRDQLWDRLRAGLGERVVLNGHPEQRLPNTLNVNFLGQVGADLLARTPELAASTGSACHEGQVHLSPVLQAMGISPAVGQGAVRLSVGRSTTGQEVDQAAAALVRGAQANP